MIRRTKIICTIGPSLDTYEKIVCLLQAGMDVARINFSHGDRETQQQQIDFLKEARRELGVPLAIMVDTRGLEIRLGQMKDSQISFCKGDKLVLTTEPTVGNKERVMISPKCVLDGLAKNTRILFADGFISSHVVETRPNEAVVEIENDGIVRSRAGVNIPGITLDLPGVTEQDIEDLRFACEQDVDVVAASFIRTPKEVITIKKLLEEGGCPEALVIAKVENREAVENFDSILQVADGMMIARGDLGVEISLSQIPKLQKAMIRKCYLAGKPSVIATQMLESMILNPRPTRAEVSDVANAIYDSASAVMLSGETAVGKYPLEAVEVMHSIIREAEGDFDYHAFFREHSTLRYNDVPSAVTLATVKTGYSTNAKAIFAFTSSGATARLLSRMRPKMPILAMTSIEKTYHQMAFIWGVIPFCCLSGSLASAFPKMCDWALEKELVSYGDLVVVSAGTTFGVSGTTNMMIVESIGEVLVRGHGGVGQQVYGNVKILLAPQGDVEPYHCRGKVLVIPRCDTSYLPFMEEAEAVVLQNQIEDTLSEISAKEAAERLNKPLIVRADGALATLREGQLVTVDPGKALVYKGVVL